MKSFKAPWSATLHVVSWSATTLCLIATVAGANTLRRHGMGNYAFWTPLLPTALIIGCALFTVRGYAITPDAIFVQRLFWRTRIPRNELQSAVVDSDALTWKTIRTFGNGGFYSFSGWYWNKQIGSFRAFITDRSRCVVLRFKNKTILVSPDAPEDFVKALELPTR